MKKLKNCIIIVILLIISLIIIYDLFIPKRNVFENCDNCIGEKYVGILTDVYYCPSDNNSNGHRIFKFQTYKCPAMINEDANERKNIDWLTLYNGSSSVGYKYHYNKDYLIFSSWNNGVKSEKSLSGSFIDERFLITVIKKYNFDIEGYKINHNDGAHNKYISLVCDGAKCTEYVSDDDLDELFDELQLYFDDLFKNNEDKIEINDNNS